MTEIIVEEHLKLIHHILKKFHPTRDSTYDDLFQVGCIGLIKAKNTFKKENGNFPTYAHVVIWNEIAMQVRKDLNYRKNVHNKSTSINTKIPNKDNNDYTLEDITPSNLNVEQQVVATDIYIRYIKGNSDAELTILGFNQVQIAKKLKKSQRSVCSRLITLRKKLKRLVM